MSVNTTAGFSISQYTATGSSMTLAHGLTKRPDMTIVKDTGTGADWIVYTKTFDGSNDYIILNSNSAKGDSGLPGVNDTVFSWGGGSGYSNTNGRTYIMYNWTSIPGYSNYIPLDPSTNKPVHKYGEPCLIILFSCIREKDIPIDKYFECFSSCDKCLLNENKDITFNH